jgi:hypothetical protein
VFAFGGVKSTDPLVWDVRESSEVRDQFYPRMGLREDDAEIKEEEEKAKRRGKRAERARKFKEIVLKSNAAANGDDGDENEEQIGNSKSLNRRPKLKK